MGRCGYESTYSVADTTAEECGRSAICECENCGTELCGGHVNECQVCERYWCLLCIVDHREGCLMTVEQLNPLKERKTTDCDVLVMAQKDQNAAPESAPFLPWIVWNPAVREMAAGFQNIPKEGNRTMVARPDGGYEFACMQCGEIYAVAPTRELIEWVEEMHQQFCKPGVAKVELRREAKAG